MFTKVALDFAEGQNMVRCSQCQTILFDMDAIDQYVHCKIPQQRYGPHFFLIREDILPSTIIIKVDQEWIQTGNMFFLMYLHHVACRKCLKNIGLHFQTVNIECNGWLLNKIAVQAHEIVIGDPVNNLTAKLLRKLEKQLNLRKQEQETEVEAQAEPKKQIIQTTYLQIQADPCPKNSFETNNDRTKREQMKKNHLVQTKKLEIELLQATKGEPSEEIVKQIVSSLGFMSTVMTILQRRAEQISQIGELLKKKVQKQIKILRRN